MPGAVPLLGKAGDAYVFPHAIWHGLSPNHSGQGAQDHPLHILALCLDRTVVMTDNNYS